MRPRILVRYLCVLAALLGPLAAVCPAQEDSPGVRLLNADEGLALVNTAWEQREQIRRKPDCSHLVHQIYDLAGFPYPYASSFDLYDGIDNFRRVSAPRAGDLIVWRGHVGIVTDAAGHTFYSSVRSGLRTESYDEPYWRAQGRPRFYRYVLSGPAELTATSASLPVDNSMAQTKAVTLPVHKEIADAPGLGAGLPAKAASPTLTSNTAPPSNRTSALPSNIMVVAAESKPTDEEVGEAISEFNSGSGNLLRDWPAANPKRFVLVYDRLRVDRIEVKRDRGWVNAEVEGKLSIGGKEIDGKHRLEKLRWELRRTPQGWQLLPPANRAYVPRDVAVRVLAGQLAFLTQNEATSDELSRSLQQQTVIVRALGLLFDPN
ncbi:MAG TPA: NlpC/P60 family protein [Candidatus Acidoferrales bacterium]|nr:NlpC/P60 family protein [Candidatus Acidoferrales bacterium]